MGPWGKRACEALQAEHERLLQYRFATGTRDTTITWELIPESDGARLRLMLEGFDLDSPMGRRALEGMKPGWPKVLEKLQAVLDAGHAPAGACRHDAP